MIRRGAMVRADASAPMLVVDVKDDIARCWWVDGAGKLRSRFHVVTTLSPLWLAFSPRSCWPDITQLDFLELEAEELRAAEERKLSKRRSKRAKRGLKLRRKKRLAA